MRNSSVSSVQFSRSVVSVSLRPHGLQHARLPCPSPIPRPCSNSCPWVSDAIQPSHPLLSPSPPALNLSQHQGLFRWVSSSHQVAKLLEFQLQSQSFQWIFRMDWEFFLCSRYQSFAVYGVCKYFLPLCSWSFYPFQRIFLINSL